MKLFCHPSITLGDPKENQFALALKTRVNMGTVALSQFTIVPYITLHGKQFPAKYVPMVMLV